MSNITTGTNDLGDFFTLPIDKKIYSQDAIMKTCYTLTNDYFIHITKNVEDEIIVYFYKKNNELDEHVLSDAVKNFLDLLHQNEMRQIILHETKVIHEEIIKRAFNAASVIALKNRDDEFDDILTPRF